MATLSQVTLLFLAAVPENMPRFQDNAEFNGIHDRLRRSDHRDRVHLQAQFAVTPDKLTEYLLEHEPSIIHISTHGVGPRLGELVFVDEIGISKPVSVEALSELFAKFQDRICCVVLNACFSAPQALAIAKQIDCVIGISGSIEDRVAIIFARQFHGALIAGESVANAFHIACAAIKVEEGPSADAYLLETRPGVNAAEVVPIPRKNTSGPFVSSDEASEPFKRKSFFPTILLTLVAIGTFLAIWTGLITDNAFSIVIRPSVIGNSMSLVDSGNVRVDMGLDVRTGKLGPDGQVTIHGIPASQAGQTAKISVVADGYIQQPGTTIETLQPGMVVRVLMARLSKRKSLILVVSPQGVRISNEYVKLLCYPDHPLGDLITDDNGMVEVDLPTDCRLYIREQRCEKNTSQKKGFEFPKERFRVPMHSRPLIATIFCLLLLGPLKGMVVATPSDDAERRDSGIDRISSDNGVTGRDTDRRDKKKDQHKSRDNDNKKDDDDSKDSSESSTDDDSTAIDDKDREDQKQRSKDLPKKVEYEILLEFNSVDDQIKLVKGWKSDIKKTIKPPQRGQQNDKTSRKVSKVSKASKSKVRIIAEIEVTNDDGLAELTIYPRNAHKYYGKSTLDFKLIHQDCKSILTVSIPWETPPSSQSVAFGKGSENKICRKQYCILRIDYSKKFMEHFKKIKGRKRKPYIEIAKYYDDSFRWPEESWKKRERFEFPKKPRAEDFRAFQARFPQNDSVYKKATFQVFKDVKEVKNNGTTFRFCSRDDTSRRPDVKVILQDETGVTPPKPPPEVKTRDRSTEMKWPSRRIRPGKLAQWLLARTNSLKYELQCADPLARKMPIFYSLVKSQQKECAWCLIGLRIQFAPSNETIELCYRDLKAGMNTEVVVKDSRGSSNAANSNVIWLEIKQIVRMLRILTKAIDAGESLRNHVYNAVSNENVVCDYSTFLETFASADRQWGELDARSPFEGRIKDWLGMILTTAYLIEPAMQHKQQCWSMIQKSRDAGALQRGEGRALDTIVGLGYSLDPRIRVYGALVARLLLNLAAGRYRKWNSFWDRVVRLCIGGNLPKRMRQARRKCNKRFRKQVLDL